MTFSTHVPAHSAENKGGIRASLYMFQLLQQRIREE
jgi:hypothetical protein